MPSVPPTETDTRLPWIDALRGYAILAIVVYHTYPWEPDLAPALRRVFDFGSIGVPLFFMVSAFTIFLTLEKSAAAGRGTWEFFVRRVFRIAPLFYLVLLVRSFPGSGQAGVFPQAEFLSALTFSAIWIPAHIDALVDHLVPGGWSICVEMWFYLLSPWLILRVRNLAAALHFALWAIVLRCVLNESLSGWTGTAYSYSRFLYYWLPNHLPMFALGMVAYHVHKSWNRTARERALVPDGSGAGLPNARGAYGLFFLAAGVYLIAASIQGFKALLPFHVLFGFGFLLVFLHLMAMPRSPVANRPLVALGRISYSAYFVHFFVIDHTRDWALPLLREAIASPTLRYIGFLAWVLALTVPVSALLHRWVELPGQALGRALIRRIRERAAAGIQPAG